MENKSALFYFKLNNKPLFKVVQDSNPELGQTLQATQRIVRGTPVVLYHGKMITSKENVETYLENPSEYIEKKAKYIRGHSSNNDISIDASQVVENFNRGEGKINLNLMGVLVNDVAKPNSLKIEDLRKYQLSTDKCNLEVSRFETSDYPLYVAKRRIKKGEILTVHYGLGYWLLQMGVKPEEISEMISKV